MEEKRLKTLQRILTVQTQLKRMAEWKLASLQQQEVELEAAQRDVIEALNSDNKLHGLFASGRAKALTALAKRTEEVRRDKVVQAEQLRERAGMARQAERRARQVGEEGRRGEERKRLEDVVEQLAPSRRTSLP